MKYISKCLKLEIDQIENLGKTLIILPKSLLHNWANEIYNFFGDRLKFYEYYDTKKNQISIDKLKEYDIVLTTYETVRSEFMLKDNSKKQENKLHSIIWFRIILDEADKIKNKNNDATNAVIDLNGIMKWVLTGTPIQNKVEDIYP